MLEISFIETEHPAAKNMPKLFGACECTAQRNGWEVVVEYHCPPDASCYSFVLMAKFDDFGLNVVYRFDRLTNRWAFEFASLFKLGEEDADVVWITRRFAMHLLANPSLVMNEFERCNQKS